MQKNHLQRQNMKPITYYCDAADPLAAKFGDRLESLNLDQRADFAEAIARKLQGKSVPQPWGDYLKGWLRKDLVGLLVGIANCLD